MSAHLFTGREREFQVFDAMLRGESPTHVLAIAGMGSVGKLELLRQFQRLADEQAYADVSRQVSRFGDDV